MTDPAEATPQAPGAPEAPARDPEVAPSEGSQQGPGRRRKALSLASPKVEIAPLTRSDGNDVLTIWDVFSIRSYSNRVLLTTDMPPMSEYTVHETAKYGVVVSCRPAGIGEWEAIAQVKTLSIGIYAAFGHWSETRQRVYESEVE